MPIIIDWLLAECADRGALAKSLTVEKGSLFHNPMPYPIKEHLDMKPNPESVQDVVLRVCGRIDDKGTLTKIVEWPISWRSA
jgi:hypothetical protein